MIAPLLALALSASPVLVDGAEATISIGRLDRMDALLGVLDRAGRHAVILRPSSWRGELHPVLALDPARLDSVAAMGIDALGGLGLSLFDEGRVTCLSISDAGSYERASDARLQQLGTVERARQSGASFVTATAQGVAVAGYVLKGRTSCATASARTERLLQRALKAMDRGPRTPPWGATPDGEVVIHLAEGATTQVRAAADALEARSRGALAGFPALKAGGLSPYGGLAPSGLMMVRARATPESVRRSLVRVGAELLRACAICDRDAVAALMAQLNAVLTGEVLVRVDRVAPPPGGLTSEAALAFAVKYAALAEVSRPDAASKALEILMKLGAARVGPDRYTLAPVNPAAGALALGLQGANLYVANDDRALEDLLSAAQRARGPSRLEHGATLFIDPRLVARTFSQLSMLDLLGSKALAPLLIAGTELGPLFAHSDRIDGWLDGDGSAQRGLMRWTFSPEPDAGR